MQAEGEGLAASFRMQKAVGKWATVEKLFVGVGRWCTGE